MTPIEELRKEIDLIDDKILELLIERVALAPKIAEAKSAGDLEHIFDGNRETAILTRLHQLSAGRLENFEINRVFLQIISICRAHQTRGKISVFGEKNGWVEDAALARFGGSALLSADEDIGDFLSHTDAGHLGFACYSPRFSQDHGEVLESLLSGRISIVEKFSFIPEFSLVSNSARDLSEAHELCVTNEVLRLLREFFMSISYDLKIKICRSASEVYENLRSVNPVAAVLPSVMLKERTDLIVLREGLKSELLGPANFMAFARVPNRDYHGDCRALLLCCLNDKAEHLIDILDVIKTFNLNVFDINTDEFEGKPWYKIAAMEISLPESQKQLEMLVGELERKCVLVKMCGFYPVFAR